MIVEKHLVVVEVKEENSRCQGEEVHEALVHVQCDKETVVRLFCNWKVGIGGSLWTNGLLLVDYLYQRRTFYEKELRGKRVIDLGSGTGLVGFAMAMLGPAQVLVTDLEDHVPVMRKNLSLNHETLSRCCSDVQAVEYAWGQTTQELKGPFDYIVGTDVAYARSLYEPLIQALKGLSCPTTRILLGISRLETERSFFKRLLEEGFEYDKVPEHEISREFRGKDFGLFEVYPSSSSLFDPKER